MCISKSQHACTSCQQRKIKLEIFWTFNKWQIVNTIFRCKINQALYIVQVEWQFDTLKSLNTFVGLSPFQLGLSNLHEIEGNGWGTIVEPLHLGHTQVSADRNISC